MPGTASPAGTTRSRGGDGGGIRLQRQAPATCSTHGQQPPRHPSPLSRQRLVPVGQDQAQVANLRGRRCPGRSAAARVGTNPPCTPRRQPGAGRAPERAAGLGVLGCWRQTPSPPSPPPPRTLPSAATGCCSPGSSRGAAGAGRPRGRRARCRPASPAAAARWRGRGRRGPAGRAAGRPRAARRCSCSGHAAPGGNAGGCPPLAPGAGLRPRSAPPWRRSRPRGQGRAPAWRGGPQGAGVGAGCPAWGCAPGRPRRRDGSVGARRRGETLRFRHFLPLSQLRPPRPFIARRPQPSQGERGKKKRKTKEKICLKTILLSFFSPPSPLRGDQVSHVIYKCLAHTRTRSPRPSPRLRAPAGPPRPFSAPLIAPPRVGSAAAAPPASGAELPAPAPSPPRPPAPAPSGSPSTSTRWDPHPRDPPIPGSRAPSPRPSYL